MNLPTLSRMTLPHLPTDEVSIPGYEIYEAIATMEYLVRYSGNGAPLKFGIHLVRGEMTIVVQYEVDDPVGTEIALRLKADFPRRWDPKSVEILKASKYPVDSWVPAGKEGDA